MKPSKYIAISGLAFLVMACEVASVSSRPVSTTGAMSARIAQYNTLKTNKAFAASDTGFSATSFGHPKEDKAIAVAMQECQRLNAQFEATNPCRVLYVNERSVSP